MYGASASMHGPAGLVLGVRPGLGLRLLETFGAPLGMLVQAFAHAGLGI